MKKNQIIRIKMSNLIINCIYKSKKKQFSLSAYMKSNSYYRLQKPSFYFFYVSHDSFFVKKDEQFMRRKYSYIQKWNLKVHVSDVHLSALYFGIYGMWNLCISYKVFWMLLLSAHTYNAFIHLCIWCFR